MVVRGGEGGNNRRACEGVSACGSGRLSVHARVRLSVRVVANAGAFGGPDVEPLISPARGQSRL
eukprot:538240-Pleurochrysis_carterae.AAC.2